MSIFKGERKLKCIIDNRDGTCIIETYVTESGLFGESYIEVRRGSMGNVHITESDIDADLDDLVAI